MLNFSGGSEYLPGQNFTLSVVVTDPTKVRFGFSMVARDADNNRVDVGTWSAESNDTRAHGPNNNHVSHQGAPFDEGSHTFTVNWRAPDSGVGDVTFYVAANAANGNGSNGSGDNVYLRQLTISEPVVQPNQPPSFSVPGGTLNITSETPTPIGGISVIDSDAGAGNVTVTLSVENGFIAVADNVPGGVGAGGISANISASVTLEGTLAQLNATFTDPNGIVYQSNPGHLGAETLQLLANDNGHAGAGGPQTGNANISISVNPPPNLSNLIYLGEGGFQFTLEGVSGLSYIVEHSDDLNTWILLEEVTLVSSMMTITDTDGANVPRRYYRTREEVPID